MINPRFAPRIGTGGLGALNPFPLSLLNKAAFHLSGLLPVSWTPS
jgi:hypothetical protein